MMGIFERRCNDLGIKLISIRKRNCFIRFFDIKHYKVEFKFKDEVYKMNAWAGIHYPQKDSIYFELYKFVEKIISKDENDFGKFINDINKNGGSK